MFPEDSVPGQRAKLRDKLATLEEPEGTHRYHPRRVHGWMERTNLQGPRREKGRTLFAKLFAKCAGGSRDGDHERSDVSQAPSATTRSQQRPANAPRPII